MRDDRERLLDIHEAIERIEKYAGGGRDALARDELIQNGGRIPAAVVYDSLA